MKSLPLLFACVVFAGCAPAILIDAEKDDIRAVWDASIEAALDGDYAGWSRAFADDIEIVHPSANIRLLGKTDVAQAYQPVFSGAPVWNSIETTRFDLELSPTGDLAWGTAETEMVVRGERQVVWFALVFQKEGGAWKMVLGFDAPRGS